jgi:hypothetical protein
MARRVVAGKVQFNLELDGEIVERLRAFAFERREKLRVVVEQALQRHMDDPPPIYKLPPLRDFPSAHGGHI